MARKKNANFIIELQEAVARLATRAGNTEQRLDRLDLDSVRERVTRAELLLAQLAEARRESRGGSSRLTSTIVTSTVVGVVVGAITTFLLGRYSAP